MWKFHYLTILQRAINSGRNSQRSQKIPPRDYVVPLIIPHSSEDDRRVWWPTKIARVLAYDSMNPQIKHSIFEIITSRQTPRLRCWPRVFQIRQLRPIKKDRENDKNWHSMNQKKSIIRLLHSEFFKPSITRRVTNDKTWSTPTSAEKSMKKPYRRIKIALKHSHTGGIIDKFEICEPSVTTSRGPMGTPRQNTSAQIAQLILSRGRFIKRAKARWEKYWVRDNGEEEMTWGAQVWEHWTAVSSWKGREALDISEGLLQCDHIHG